MRFNKMQKLFFAYFALITIYWVWLQTTNYRETNYNYFYSFAFSLMPLIGGVVGLVGIRVWGRFRSALGQAVGFFSIGLFSWALGSMIWAYYNFVLHEPAPYPSVADIFYVAALPLWVLGAYNLSKASGARFGWRKPLMKFFAVLIPVAAVAASYYLLVSVARDGTLLTDTSALTKTILDISYPLGDVLILTGSLLIFGLSFRLLGGYYRNSMFIWLGGIVVMYFADFIFSYTTTTGSFYVGNWGDLIFATAMFLMTFGVLGFVEKPRVESEDK